MTFTRKRPFLSMALLSILAIPSFPLSNAFVPSYLTASAFASVASRSLWLWEEGSSSWRIDEWSSTRLHASSVPQAKSKRKSKRSGKTSTTNRKSNSPGRSLSHEEVAEHVSARYIAGRGGPFDSKMRSRGLVGDTSDNIQNEDQARFLKELNQRPALVLNADYQPLSYLPLSLWSWQDAIKAIFGGKVTVVDVYPDISVRAASLEVPLPSVIALGDYVSQKHKRPAFTRRNVFLRDEYKCQYCKDRFHTADLSLDHVVPRCMGGTLNWENAVTSCLKCNGRKGSMPVSDLPSIGMKLVREPRCPTQMELAAKAARMVPRRVHPTWKPYLGIQDVRPSTSVAGSRGSGDEAFIDDRYFEADLE